MDDRAISGLTKWPVFGAAALIFAKIEEMTGSKSLAFVAPLVCYLYVLWFSFAARGAKVHEIQEDVVAAH